MTFKRDNCESNGVGCKDFLFCMEVDECRMQHTLVKFLLKIRVKCDFFLSCLTRGSTRLIVGHMSTFFHEERDDMLDFVTSPLGLEQCVGSTCQMPKVHYV